MSKNKYQKDRRMKIFMNANAPWAPSGYGVHVRELLFSWIADGWNCACSCYYGLEGATINMNGLKCYPKMGDTWGADAMVYHAQDFGADITLAMMDVWVLDPNFLAKVKNFIPYVPIDHTPVPPRVLDRLRYAYKIITFSKFGQSELEKAGFTSTCIPEGTNVDIFKPMDKKEMRRRFNIPENLFLFGMVGANKDNPPRKGFQEALDAFKMFHEKHPDSAIFIHTLLQQEGGFPIADYCKFLDIEKQLYYVDPYHAMWHSDHNIIAQEMNMFDVLLQPSSNEGFGLPIIESQACGVPAIVNNTTAMPELIIEGVTGEICDATQPRWTPLQGYVAHADTLSLYNKMETLYSKLQAPNTIAKDCRDHVLKNYNIETSIKEQWIPMLEEIQSDLLPTLKNKATTANIQSIG